MIMIMNESTNALNKRDVEFEELIRRNYRLLSDENGFRKYRNSNGNVLIVTDL